MKNLILMTVMFLMAATASADSSEAKTKVLLKLAELNSKILNDTDSHIDYQKIEALLDQALTAPNWTLSCSQKYDGNYTLQMNGEDLGAGVGIDQATCEKTLATSNAFACVKSAFDGFWLYDLAQNSMVGSNMELDTCQAIVQKSVHGKTCYKSAISEGEFWLYETANNGNLLEFGLGLNECLGKL